MNTKPLVFVEVREGRKIVGSNSAPLETVQSLMLLSMAAGKVMVETAKLREGNSFTFTLKGKSVTVRPLHNHIDNY